MSSRGVIEGLVIKESVISAYSIYYTLNLPVLPPDKIRFPADEKVYSKISQYSSSSFRNCYFTVPLTCLARLWLEAGRTA